MKLYSSTLFLNPFLNLFGLMSSKVIHNKVNLFIYSKSILSGMPGFIGSFGIFLPRACIPVFSSIHITRAFSGGFMYKPTTCADFSSNSGSLLVSHISTWCGFKSASDNMRFIVDLLICKSSFLSVFARSLFVQWVILSGLWHALAITFKRSLLPNILGRPERGVSFNPSIRFILNFLRQRLAVTRLMPSNLSISSRLLPSSVRRIILLRSTIRCSEVLERIIDSSSIFSDSLKLRFIGFLATVTSLFKLCYSWLRYYILTNHKSKSIYGTIH